MIVKKSKNELRQKRHFRIRRKVSGTATRPRLNIYRSNKNIFAQVIDDNAGVTLVSANSVQMKLTSTGVAAAKEVGSEVAKLAKAANITEVVFDRGGYLYHGRVKALADAAREAGLEF
ncbi:MAG: 50S ribosomal protein L18 [Erysipelothrix sp.]|nr:50S ribosomal protein L18 [Erysipelothrix sp.]